jgi:hypothetical protein
LAIRKRERIPSSTATAIPTNRAKRTAGVGGVSSTGGNARRMINQMITGRRIAAVRVIARLFVKNPLI